MRQFIRHPADIPLSFSLGGKSEAEYRDHLVDVGVGGICFCTSYKLRKGMNIHLEIPLEQSPFSADGVVVWCRPRNDSYIVGVKFDDAATRYSVRMVEQVCYICDYRARAMIEEGRDLALEEAAAEWVEKYAQHFPG